MNTRERSKLWMRDWTKKKKATKTKNPHKFKIKEDYAIFYVTSGSDIHKVKIDIEDLDRVLQYRWHYENGYLDNNQLGCLHNFVMGNNGRLYDHINRKRTDNRKENLRPCTRTKNQCNRGMQRNNSLGVKGVYYSKAADKYQSQIAVAGKRMHLGLFTDIIDAARAYNKAAKKFHGEFAVLNNIKALKAAV